MLKHPVLLLSCMLDFVCLDNEFRGRNSYFGGANIIS